MKQGKLQRFRMAAMLLIAGICLMVPVHVHADENFEYDILVDGTTKITAYNGENSSEPITIPKELDGQYLVTQIGEDVFAGLSSLTTVSFHADSVVTSIGDRAFEDCSSLTSVTLPDSVTSIGESAFSGCVAFTTVTIPDNTTVTLPSTLEVIEKNAFNGCSKLAAITLPAGLETIGDYAFQKSGLTGINIPAGVTGIGKQAFDNCASLASVTVDGGNTVYQSQDGCLYSKDGKTLYLYPKGKTGAEYTVPAETTRIEDYAFYSNNKLTSVTIPGSVQAIGEYAFGSCRFLASVTLGEGLTQIGSRAFIGCSKLETITIPASVTVIRQNTFGGCTALANIYYKGSQQQWEQIVSQNQLNLGTVAMEYSYGHEHQFSCVASGATVTVSCTSEGCGYTTNKGYKVVIAAASKAYDGNRHKRYRFPVRGFRRECYLCRS